MKSPPRWSSVQLAKEAKISSSLFREARLKPTEQWKKHVEQAAGQFESLFGLLGDLAPSRMVDASVAKAFRQDLGEAMRYLAGPFISADDLKVVADISSLSPNVIGSNSTEAAKAFAVIKQIIDPYRFPWVKAGRKPTKAERVAAVMASSILMAASTVGTERRHLGKKDQEESVRCHLIKIGFKQVSPRTITTLMNAPAQNEFCMECKLGSRKADLVVRLPDTRLMPIECKVSNSATNSVKRINNDAAAKATKWIKDFGDIQVVPTAVISGVFKVSNLTQAQEAGLTIFWAHDLKKLGTFVRQTGA